MAVRWSDGTDTRIDLAPLVRRYKGLAPLRRSALFKRAEVADWGWAVRWDERTDVAARTLYRLAMEQSGQFMRADDFRRWGRDAG